jgi:hypothetical protein
MSSPPAHHCILNLFTWMSETLLIFLLSRVSKRLVTHMPIHSGTIGRSSAAFHTQLAAASRAGKRLNMLKQHSSRLCCTCWPVHRTLYTQAPVEQLPGMPPPFPPTAAATATPTHASLLSMHAWDATATTSALRRSQSGPRTCREDPACTDDRASAVGIWIISVRQRKQRSHVGEGGAPQSLGVYDCAQQGGAGCCQPPSKF